MEHFYKIKGDYAEITLSKNIYPLITIKKAIANYFENSYIKLEETKESIVINLKTKVDKINLENIIGEFYNELLRESIRYDISKETKNLRELIVARALYTTCIETDDFNYSNSEKETKEVDNFNVDDIATNWFDKNDKGEK